MPEGLHSELRALLSAHSASSAFSSRPSPLPALLPPAAFRTPGGIHRPAAACGPPAPAFRSWELNSKAITIQIFSRTWAESITIRQNLYEIFRIRNPLATVPFPVADVVGEPSVEMTARDPYGAEPGFLSDFYEKPLVPSACALQDPLFAELLGQSLGGKAELLIRRHASVARSGGFAGWSRSRVAPPKAGSPLSRA